MRFVERHAWKVFAGLSLIVILFGIGDLLQGGETFRSGESVLFQAITGNTWDELVAADPAAARLIDQQVRSTGGILIVMGLLSLAVCVTALRRGERWAWYSMWIWPLWFLLIYATFWTVQPDFGGGVPVPLVSGTIFLVITVVTLALSYRRYRGQP
jgi:hypothetical protein